MCEEDMDDECFCDTCRNIYCERSSVYTNKLKAEFYNPYKIMKDAYIEAHGNG